MGAEELPLVIYSTQQHSSLTDKWNMLINEPLGGSPNGLDYHFSCKTGAHERLRHLTKAEEKKRRCLISTHAPVHASSGHLCRHRPALKPEHWRLKASWLQPSTTLRITINITITFLYTDGETPKPSPWQLHGTIVGFGATRRGRINADTYHRAGRKTPIIKRNESLLSAYRVYSPVIHLNPSGRGRKTSWAVSPDYLWRKLQTVDRDQRCRAVFIIRWPPWAPPLSHLRLLTKLISS